MPPRKPHGFQQIVHDAELGFQKVSPYGPRDDKRDDIRDEQDRPEDVLSPQLLAEQKCKKQGHADDEGNIHDDKLKGDAQGMPPPHVLRQLNIVGEADEFPRVRKIPFEKAEKEDVEHGQKPENEQTGHIGKQKQIAQDGVLVFSGFPSQGFAGAPQTDQSRSPPSKKGGQGMLLSRR